MAENTQLIGLENKGDYLLVTFRSYESQERMEAEISAMYDAVDRHGARRLLIDCRATRKQIPVIEFYELCLYLASKFGPSGIRMAVLASPEAAYPDRFGENVARNRGLDLIRFINNEQETLEWLLGRTPASLIRHF